MDFRLQLTAAAFGDLPAAMKEELAKGSAAVTAGTDLTREQLVAALRAQVIAAFGSQRLANTWRGRLYKNDGLNAAAVVYSNAPHIVEAFSAATVITSPNGFWLAIPSPEIMTMRFAGGHRPTPALVEQRLAIKLVFVYRQGKSSLLVAPQVRKHTGKRHGYSKASPTAIARGTVEDAVMFFLVPMVRLTQRLDPEAAYTAALDNLVRNVLDEWNR